MPLHVQNKLYCSLSSRLDVPLSPRPAAISPSATPWRPRLGRKTITNSPDPDRRRPVPPARCPPTAHGWHIAAALAMGVAQADGFYEGLIVRECSRCRYTECWSGEQNAQSQTLRLHEAWQAA